MRWEIIKAFTSPYPKKQFVLYVLVIEKQTQTGFERSFTCVPSRAKNSRSSYFIPATKKWCSVFDECRERLGCLGNEEPDLKKAWKCVAEDLVRASSPRTLHQEREVIDDVLKGVDVDQAKKIANDKKKLQEYLSKVCW